MRLFDHMARLATGDLHSLIFMRVWTRDEYPLSPYLQLMEESLLFPSFEYTVESGLIHRSRAYEGFLELREGELLLLVKEFFEIALMERREHIPRKEKCTPDRVHFFKADTSILCIFLQMQVFLWNYHLIKGTTLTQDTHQYVPAIRTLVRVKQGS